VRADRVCSAADLTADRAVLKDVQVSEAALKQRDQAVSAARRVISRLPTANGHSKLKRKPFNNNGQPMQMQMRRRLLSDALFLPCWFWGP